MRLAVGPKERGGSLNQRAGFLCAVLVALLSLSDATLAGERIPPAGSLSRERAAPLTGTPLVAILCYHDLSDDPARKNYTIPPERFRLHLRRLREAGWTFLSLSELLSRKGRFDKLPPKVIVVTFDDAYRSFFEKALPILREEGVKATLSVISSFIDAPPGDLPPLMTWDQIREAGESGFVDIASHSHGLHQYETCNPYNGHLALRDDPPIPLSRPAIRGSGRVPVADPPRPSKGEIVAGAERRPRCKRPGLALRGAQRHGARAGPPGGVPRHPRVGGDRCPAGGPRPGAPPAGDGHGRDESRRGEPRLALPPPASRPGGAGGSRRRLRSGSRDLPGPGGPPGAKDPGGGREHRVPSGAGRPAGDGQYVFSNHQPGARHLVDAPTFAMPGSASGRARP
jgi:hypothetical protein